ncbi:aldehyde dehydrogenase family protein [Streptomyces profundus]|nr:aldehyde dehydrogenase family protein [Streptomyces sp. MA3_2.13]
MLDAAALAGPWAGGRGGSRTQTEPGSGRPIAGIGLAATEDVERAALAAVAAQESWARTTCAERALVLREAAAVLAAHSDEVADWVNRETGGVGAKGAGEVAAAIEELYAGAALAAEPCGELLPGSAPGQFGYARRVPVGVVGVITPWNAPLRLAARAVVPALALGNAVLLKPDEQTAIGGGLVLAAAFARAGLPAGLLAVLPGPAEVGEALVASEHTAVISFTGSTATGRRIGSIAGGLLKRAVLELGGNNAFVVLDDADLPAAVDAALRASLAHNGQICMAAGRHLVHQDLAEEYTAALVERLARLRCGDPRVAEVAIGPLINGRQADRVAGIVADSVAAGAELRLGGRPLDTGPGAGTLTGLYPPTVLTGVRPGMPAFDEEIFGPVIPVTSFADDEEAVRLARATAYGLSAAIHTADPVRGRAFADRLPTGMAHVNGSTIDDAPHVPMGGLGLSGNGHRSGGRWNVEAFTFTQWVTVLDRPRAPRKAG